jgi:hypothetical protein
MNRMKKNLALGVAWFLLFPMVVVGTAGACFALPTGIPSHAAIEGIRFPADAGTYIAPAKVGESVSSYERSHKRFELAGRLAVAFDRRTLSDASGAGRAVLPVFTEPFAPTWLEQPNPQAPPSL